MNDPVWVARDGFRLASFASGQGDGAPAIVLSNSLGADHTMWAEQMDMLNRHYRVIAYDTRGHGQSDAPAGDYSFVDLVADAHAVMDHHWVDRADYMGLSLGCMTGLGLALAHPDRLNRLVCAAGRADAPQAFVENWDTRLKLIDEGGLDKVWPMTEALWFTEGYRALQPTRVGELKDAFLGTSETGYRGCAAALKGLDYLRHLGGIVTPTLFIAGEHDKGAPAVTMREMAAATPGAEFIEIAGAAHIVNAGAPEAYDAAIARFLGL